MVSHLASLWNRGLRQLGNGLSEFNTTYQSMIIYFMGQIKSLTNMKHLNISIKCQLPRTSIIEVLGNWPLTPPLSHNFSFSEKCKCWLTEGVGGQRQLIQIIPPWTRWQGHNYNNNCDRRVTPKELPGWYGKNSVLFTKRKNLERKKERKIQKYKCNAPLYKLRLGCNGIAGMPYIQWCGQTEEI